jgi:hypothetical protein
MRNGLALLGVAIFGILLGAHDIVNGDAAFCGYVHEVRCPWCVSQAGTYGCRCNEVSGDCVHEYGGPPTAVIICEWDTWTYTYDYDGYYLDLALALCKTVKICDKTWPFMDCDDWANPCKVWTSETYELRWEEGARCGT